LPNHTVTVARSKGWDTLSNGELLTAADAAGFQVLLTTDKNLGYQQNLGGRRIAIVVLGRGSWPLIKPVLATVTAAVNAAKAGTFTVVDIPERR
jgi:hypothetical protein